MIGIFKPAKRKVFKSGYLYKSIYCSICLSLRKRYGLFFTMFICHEIIQLVISLLQYCPNLISSCSNCVLCWNRSNKEIIKHPLIDKAADCCLILVWFKILDAKNDKENMVYQLLYLVFKKRIELICNQSPTIDGIIKKYLSVMNSSVFNDVIIGTQDAAQSLYNELMMMTDIDIESKNKLLQIARFYGYIIVIADPLIDYKKDIAKGKYNPFVVESYSDYYQLFIKTITDATTYIYQLLSQGYVTSYFYCTYIASRNNIMNNKFYVNTNHK